MVESIRKHIRKNIFIIDMLHVSKPEINGKNAAKTNNCGTRLVMPDAK